MRNKLSDEADLVIGQRLKFLREQQKMTLKELSNKLGMTQQIYEKYEYSRTMPTGRVIRRFAEFYDVSADFILGIVNFPISIYRGMPKNE